MQTGFKCSKYATCIFDEKIKKIHAQFESIPT